MIGENRISHTILDTQPNWEMRERTIDLVELEKRLSKYENHLEYFPTIDFQSSFADIHYFTNCNLIHL